MEIRAIDLPLLRDEVIEYLESGRRDLMTVEHAVSNGERRSVAEKMARDFSRGEAANLRAADLYFVDRRMADLANVAATDTLPLAAEDVPSRRGFMYFDLDLPAFMAPGWDRAPVRAMSWQFEMKDTYLLVVLYADPTTVDATDPVELQYMSRLVWASSWFVSLGEGDSFGMGGTPPGAIARLKAAMLLMGQAVASVAEAEYDRAARRRLQKRGKEPPPVRVITLRRSASHGGDGEPDREYHHQWVVKGHWRMQPWGPNRERRRPVWIAPHIKGPSDAPLLGGEKVYVLRKTPRSTSTEGPSSE